tara:strand:- start:3600 stop:6938 length:3339 start_codon:yes stop_codon:yes gene_type:complete
MKVRLVAYRRETTTDDLSNLTQFELDLQSAPQIFANYNWLDIKEPDKRKSSFSQTIKIPFTERNNKFFESWFDVNSDILVFDAYKKFPAIIFVDSVPQLQGFLQLKSIYVNARMYEVVVFGNSADLFSDVKGKYLEDVFTTELEGTPGTFVTDTSLDHTLTRENVINSWQNGLTTINSVQDKDVMYPVIDYGHTTNPFSTGMFSSFSGLQDIIDDNVITGFNWSNITQLFGTLTPRLLKPAIRLQRLIYMLCSKAGYSINSTFLGINGDVLADDVDFHKIFMTCATESTYVKTTPIEAFQAVGAASQNIDSCTGEDCLTTIPFTSTNYNGASYFILNPGTDVPGNGSAFFIPNYGNNGEGLAFGNQVVLYDISLSIGCPANENDGTPLNNWQVQLAIYTVYQNGTSAFLSPQTYAFNTNNTASTVNISYTPNVQTSPGSYNYLSIWFSASSTTTFTVQNPEWTLVNNGSGFYSDGFENGTVTMRANMPKITQVDFLKDIVTRYNLVVLNDPNNPTQLTIEPYQDYIASGSTQYWTDKLDISKEAVIKTTAELQNRTLLLTDQEGNDMINERYQNTYNRVYGSIEVKNRNDFAQNDFKNSSVFSPFVVHGMPDASIFGVLGGVSSWTKIPIHYAGYVNDNGEWSARSSQKPSLFYYSGTPSTFAGYDGFNGVAWDWALTQADYGITNFSWGYSDVSSILGYQGFPLCLPYNIESGDTTNPLDSDNPLLTTNNMLFWTWYSATFYPSGFFGIWGGNVFGENVTQNGYYNRFWRQYINEVYDNEARMMECYVNLSPGDIFEFEANAFKNPVYIKNTLWRVLKIQKHLIGGNESTKVTLLKVLEKTNYDCYLSPTNFTPAGKIQYTASDGSLTFTTTNTCCEDLNENWTFEETNASTGEGNCWHNQDSVSIGGGDGTDVDPTVPQPMPILPQLPNTQTNFIGVDGLNQKFQNIVYNLESSTDDNSTPNYFTVMGSRPFVLQVPVNYLITMRVEVTGEIVKGSNMGKVGFFEVYGICKNNSGVLSHLGTTGGDLIREQKDTGFATPTFRVNVLESSTNVLNLKIIGGDSQSYQFKAKVSVTAKQIRGNTKQLSIPDQAIYQNSDFIMYQNGGLLLWN